MSTDAIAIRGSGDYCAAVDADVPELKALVRETLGEPVRRIGRFIQLALIGAGRCVGGETLAPATAVYLSSGRGDLEITIEVMETLFRAGHSPMPLSFINTVSNSACYYIARQFGLHGRSNFICNRHFAFESALQLALLDLRAGLVDSALVGSVDVAVAPLRDHRRRLELAADAALAEGSHWLWLQHAPAGDGAPQLLDARQFADRADLDAWLRTLSPQRTAIALASGQFLPTAIADDIAEAHGFDAHFDYRSGRGYYDSQSGAVLGAFLHRADPRPLLLHLNADPDGRFSAMLVRAPR